MWMNIVYLCSRRGWLLVYGFRGTGKLILKLSSYERGTRGAERKVRGTCLACLLKVIPFRLSLPTRGVCTSYSGIVGRASGKLYYIDDGGATK